MVNKNSERVVFDIISGIPGMGRPGDADIKRLAGLTNTNYLVVVNEEKYFVRVAGENTETLGINREYEIEALTAASEAGIGPQLLHAVLPEGHFVTRYIEGEHWTLDEYRQPVNIQRLVDTVKHLHSLPPIRAEFSIFDRVDRMTKKARALQAPFPHDFNRFKQQSKIIQQNQRQDQSSWLRFCHNDLFSVNILDDGRVRFIDWEFAGMGDIYFDLATLFYAYDTLDTLTLEQGEYVLECYFGEVNEEIWVRLQGMRFMIILFSAMWGLLQNGLQNEGKVEKVEGFEFLEYAEMSFIEMRKLLDG